MTKCSIHSPTGHGRGDKPNASAPLLVHFTFGSVRGNYIPSFGHMTTIGKVLQDLKLLLDNMLLWSHWRMG